MIADIVIGLSYGDEGKGKVTHHLLKSGEYTHCLRFNGGCNAGHTIYHNGQKFVTHHIPAGVFFGVKSIIGPGCVVNLEQFYKEIAMLEEAGIAVKGSIYIANNAHIITDAHLEEDGLDSAIGTTKRGNGPAYRDKYNRKGLRAQEVPELQASSYLIDVYREFYERDPPLSCVRGPKVLVWTLIGESIPTLHRAIVRRQAPYLMLSILKQCAGFMELQKHTILM